MAFEQGLSDEHRPLALTGPTLASLSFSALLCFHVWLAVVHMWSES